MIDYLKKLAGIRRERKNSSAAVYWSAAETLAAGKEPRVRAEALAEACDDLRRTEQDLAADAQLLAEHRRASEQAARADAARARLRNAQRELAAADQRAAQLEADAKRIRAAAQAGVEEAGLEQQLVERAQQAARDLEAKLAKRGQPPAVEAAAQAELARQIESIENDLRLARAELDEAEVLENDATAALAQANSGKVAVDDRTAWARTTLGVIASRRAKVAQLEGELARVQAGDDSGEPSAAADLFDNDVNLEEVTR